MDRRLFVKGCGFLPFLGLSTEKTGDKEVPVIRPEGITLTTSLGVWDQEVKLLPTFTCSSTCAEDIRRKHIHDLDITMLAYFQGRGFEKEAQQYLANRNDPKLDAFYKTLVW